MKNPLTSAGIEPATFRFVAQHLNHCATAVPRTGRENQKIIIKKQYEDKKIKMGSEGKMRGRRKRRNGSLRLSLTHTVYIQHHAFNKCMNCLGITRHS